MCVCIFVTIDNGFQLTDKICFINNFHFLCVFLISYGNLQSTLEYNVFITTFHRTFSYFLTS